MAADVREPYIYLFGLPIWRIRVASAVLDISRGIVLATWALFGFYDCLLGHDGVLPGYPEILF